MSETLGLEIVSGFVSTKKRSSALVSTKKKVIGFRFNQKKGHRLSFQPKKEVIGFRSFGPGPKTIN